jgi:opacity protein-like surface antigen
VQEDCSTSVTRYSYMFGPVVAAHLRTVTPFAHVLFGRTSNSYNGASSDSYTAFTWAAGGGLDVNVFRRFAVRLGQFDYGECAPQARAAYLL